MIYRPAIQTAAEVIAAHLDAVDMAVPEPSAEDRAAAIAAVLDHHGLLYTYAPHTNPAEVSEFTELGNPHRAAWYASHAMTDPDLPTSLPKVDHHA